MERFQVSIGFVLVLSLSFLLSCKDQDIESDPGKLQVLRVKVGTTTLNTGQKVEEVPVDQPIVISFSQVLDTASVNENIILRDKESNPVPLHFTFFDDNRSVNAQTGDSLAFLTDYFLELREGLKGAAGEAFPGLGYSFQTENATMILENIRINAIDMTGSGRIKDIPVNPTIRASFNFPVDRNLMESGTSLYASGINAQLNFSYQDDDKTVIIQPTSDLVHYFKYYLDLNTTIKSKEGFDFDGFSSSFYTQLDSTLKFPMISDEELLTLVQEQTFKFYYDFAHPVSKLSRERNTSGETCAIGGSGFGIMAHVVAMERGFITRSQGLDRLQTMLDFLETGDRFHGAWPHWINGTTGKVVPFSSNDDGGDLVETSYMAMGLMTLRQYLDDQVPSEADMIDQINTLLDGIEWDWYTQGGQNVLYWHWSPNYGWEKNHQIRGWNEALITYVMAATSSTHGIDAEVYHEGWARSGGMINGNEYYGIELPLGNQAYGGPLFFAHYSFLGIDPHGLSDQYADYWKQDVNHTLINYSYCVDNPENYVGYSEDCWGLTASDGNQGYSAHSPTNDRGVITPTAAISSIVYTPDKSMDAMRHFYYFLGDRLWGAYGFYDAFNVTAGWWADSYITIDQGPIIGMIENYRTGLLWNLFMSAPEVQNALTKLGFTY